METASLSPDVQAYEVLDVLRRRILVDGFEIVVDPQASHDSTMHDAVSGREFLDFYSFFASMPLSFNHEKLGDPRYQADLLAAAGVKVANADIYSRYYAQFVRTVDEIAAPEGFTHFFFIDGGALAVENALKAAFDWKVRKNMAAGRGEIGSQVIHFKEAFHGRTGYTMSLTNTDPRKTMYFPQFQWPRIDNPGINFGLSEPERGEDVKAREENAIQQIHQAIGEHDHDIAAMIIEPIQGEGGDTHFRPEFLVRLREICDEHEILLIFDEVQTGVGLTGSMWAFEQMGVTPDIFSFGKKMQQCGIMAGARIDEVEDNVFKVPSRINSTWGGNLPDMVRASRILRIIHEDDLVSRAAESGAMLLEHLERLADKHEMVSAPRGRGLMCAFDLPTDGLRDKVRVACYERDMLVLSCGAKSLRFRPVLDVSGDDLDRGIEILDEALTAIASAD